MIPSINGKKIYECTEEDLQEIINNPEYREDDSVDYKETFSIFDISKDRTKDRQSAIFEFRSDVCSFANAKGGCLVYGVMEDGNGVPKEIKGILIEGNNTDKFELSIKDWLSPIEPRIPSYTVKFIQLKNEKYIVIILVKHDSFAPYIHLANEKDFMIYKRIGNSKSPISYSEMKNMFTNSTVVEKEIDQYRDKRINNYYFQTEDSESRFSKFLMLHIIPDTFLDREYDQPVYVWERKGRRFYSMFSAFSCDSISIPMVGGLRYTNHQGFSEYAIYNNGVAEVFYPLNDLLRMNYDVPRGFFPWKLIWNMIESFIREYNGLVHNLFPTERVFVGISVIGCKGVATDYSYNSDPISTIDRELLKMSTYALEELNSGCNIDSNLKRIQIDYMTSLGIKTCQELDELVREVYGEW